MSVEGDVGSVGSSGRLGVVAIGNNGGLAGTWLEDANNNGGGGVNGGNGTSNTGGFVAVVWDGFGVGAAERVVDGVSGSE